MKYIGLILLYLFQANYVGIISVGKESACNTGDMGSIPGSERRRSPGEGNSNPQQYSCLENPIGRGAWWSMRLQVRHDLVTKPQPPHSDSIIFLNYTQYKVTINFADIPCTVYNILWHLFYIQ